MNEVAPWLASAVTLAVAVISFVMGYKIGQYDANKAVEEVTGLDILEDPNDNVG